MKDVVLPLTFVLYEHSEPSHPRINQVKWNPKFRGILAAACADGKLRVWDVYGRKFIFQQKAHKGEILHTAWSSDGKLLASGGFDGKIISWSFKRDETRIEEDRSKSIDAEIIDLKYDPESSYIHALIRGKDDKLFRFEYRYYTGLEEKEIFIPNIASSQAAYKFVFDNTGRYIALGIIERDVYPTRIRVMICNYSNLSLAISQPIYFPSENILKMLWTPNDDVLVATKDGILVVSVNRKVTGKYLEIKSKEINLDSKGSISSVTYSPDGEYYLIGYENGTIVIWDARKQHALFDFHVEGIDGIEVYLTDIDLGIDYLLAVGDSAGRIRVYDFRKLNNILVRSIKLFQNIKHNKYNDAIKNAREILFSLAMNEILGVMDLYEKQVLTDEDILFIFSELPRDTVKGVINYVRNLRRIARTRDDIDLLEKVIKQLEELSKALDRKDTKMFLGALKAISIILGPAAYPIYISASLTDALSPIIRFITEKIRERVRQRS
ncbi:MAG: hypothetical protein ACTSVA_03395, partial [Candidatus Njordarchaeales archaeon]